MRRLAFSVVLVHIVVCCGAHAAAPRWSQLTQLSFQHLTQSQGLPNEIATAVAQDGQGFLWVGTMSGIARWDGYRLKVYKPEPNAAGSMPDNVVSQLHGDSAGRLWIGTSAAGLVRYDAEHDRFVRYPVGDDGLAHVSVQAIVDDGAGGLWVGSDGGLDHVDAAGAKIRRERAPGPGPVKALLRDRRGALWAGTPAGLFRRDAGGGGFVPVTLAAGEQPFPQSLAEDSSGRIWIGTLRNGAFVIEPGGAAQPVHESSKPDGAAALEIQQVVAVAEVQPDEVWLATLGQGIVAVDTAARETRRIRHQPTLPLSLADNTLHGLFRDRSGLVWAATDRGVSRHDPRQSAVLTWFGPPVRGEAPLRSSTEVSGILPVAGNRLWLATHKRGIDIIDTSGALVGALRPDAKKPDSALPEDKVIALERASDGSVFIATKRGLYRAGSDGRRVVRVKMAGRDPAASTWALLVDGGTLWVGGQTDGLWRVDLASGACERMLRGAERLSDERVTALARAPGGSLWVGTRFGLNRFEPASGRVSRFVPDVASAESLANGFIGTLHTDARGRLWVGTYGGGISVLEAGGARLRRLGRAQGLPDENINAFVEDATGRLWASTDDGLAMIDSERFTARALRGAEGAVLPTYWTNAAARTEAGELLFGGAGGMTIVRPEKLQPWTWRPPVVATEIHVGGRRLVALPAGEAAPIVVPAGANTLAVEFAAIDYSAPERNRYAYRLEGFDADWVETDNTRRLAAYTNLPPGDYRLLLRGSNRNGEWSQNELVLPVRVLPAWHQTLWARAGAAVLALAALSGIVGWRTAALRVRQAELERKVRERTAELEAVSRALEEKSRVLELTAITDPLTGLHNRRFLTEHIETEVAASLRRAAEMRAAAGAPVDTDNVFFLVDVDRFKQVNDVHGHAAGDAVLVQVGKRLGGMMRESDHLVRWGGEEFLAVARDTDRTRAEELAERMRCVIAEAPFVADDGRLLAVTCSIGFACLPFDRAAPRVFDWQDVVKLADIALYAAKRAGRDAWVGLHAAEGAAALPARALTSPQQAVLDGTLRFTSNRTAAAVQAALAGRDHGPAPAPSPDRAPVT